MIVNFRVFRISRGAHKLTRTLILIKKKIKTLIKEIASSCHHDLYGEKKAPIFRLLYKLLILILISATALISACYVI